MMFWRKLGLTDDVIPANEMNHCRGAWVAGMQRGCNEYQKPKNSVPATGVRRNPICRRFFSGSALGAKFEVVVGVVSAIEVTLRQNRVAFLAKMFVSHRRSPSARV